jgi:hypothetical protein
VDHNGLRFPEPIDKGAVLAQDSVVIEDPTSPYSSSTELSVYGLYFYRKHLLKNPKYSGDLKPVMYLDDVLTSLHQFIDSTRKFYSLIEYWGPLWFQLQLEDLRDYGMVGSQQLKMGTAAPCRDSYICISRTLPGFPPGDADKKEFLINIARHVLWSFAWDVDKDNLEKYFAN